MAAAFTVAPGSPLGIGLHARWASGAVRQSREPLSGEGPVASGGDDPELARGRFGHGERVPAAQGSGKELQLAGGALLQSHPWKPRNRRLPRCWWRPRWEPECGWRSPAMPEAKSKPRAPGASALDDAITYIAPLHMVVAPADGLTSAVEQAGFIIRRRATIARRPCPNAGPELITGKSGNR